MDYPYIRKNKYNVSNDYWFLPTDMFSTVRDKEQASQTVRKSPIISYFDEISRKDVFNYVIIILIVTLFFFRLDLNWTIWIGIVMGCIVVYYFNERNAQALNSKSDQLWTVLKSPLLKHTKYFITDPPIIQWVDQTGELKKYNVLEFNKMINNLDRLLKLINDIKVGVAQCKETLDLIKNLKVTILNQFHSIIYKIDNADIRNKYNKYLQQLGYLLNERHDNLINICKFYYLMKPTNIDSHYDITNMDEPSPNDTMNDPHYNFYN